MMHRIKQLTVVVALLALPSHSVAFDFDAEMGGGSSAAPSKKHTSSKTHFDFDAEMSGDHRQNTHYASPSTNSSASSSDDILGGVMQGRAEIKEKKSVQAFAQLSDNLDQACHCSLSSKDCSGGMDLATYRTDKYLNKVNGLIKKVDELCFSWAGEKKKRFVSTEKRDAFIQVWKSNETSLLADRDSLVGLLKDDGKQYAYLEKKRRQEEEAARRRAEQKANQKSFWAAAAGVAMAGMAAHVGADASQAVEAGMKLRNSIANDDPQSFQRYANKLQLQAMQKEIQRRRAESLNGNSDSQNSITGSSVGSCNVNTAWTGDPQWTQEVSHCKAACVESNRGNSTGVSANCTIMDKFQSRFNEGPGSSGCSVCPSYSGKIWTGNSNTRPSTSSQRQYNAPARKPARKRSVYHCDNPPCGMAR